MKLKAMFLLCKPLLQFFLQFNHLLSGAVSKYQHFAKLLHLHLFRFSQRKTGARQRLCLFKCCMLFSYPVSRFRAFSSFMTLTISTPTQNARNISEQTLGCHETKMMDVRISSCQKFSKTLKKLRRLRWVYLLQQSEVNCYLINQIITSQ